MLELINVGIAGVCDACARLIIGTETLAMFCV
jgi:hypothetical protein